MHAGGDGEELDRLLARLAEIRKEEGDTRDDFEVHVISYDAYDLDGIKRLEDKGVTDCIVGFRVPYIKGPDTEPLRDQDRAPRAVRREHHRDGELTVTEVHARAGDPTSALACAAPTWAGPNMTETGTAPHHSKRGGELIFNAPFIRTEQDRLEGYDYLAGRIRMAMQMAFDYDLDRPLFVNPTHQFSRQGLDNPDARLLQRVPARGREYVVAGRRGTTADLSFQVMGGPVLRRLRPPPR